MLVAGIEDLLRAVDGADERRVYEGLRRLIPEFTGTGEKAAASVPTGAEKAEGG